MSAILTQPQYVKSFNIFNNLFVSWWFQVSWVHGTSTKKHLVLYSK